MLHRRLWPVEVNGNIHSFGSLFDGLFLNLVEERGLAQARSELLRPFSRRWTLLLK
ncbi:hypothetical protein HQ496_07385 [bacterium]|nr:hypothetical protein [bacterium]